MAEIVDLWSDTIKVEKMITPVIILRQQASLLGKKTKNIVQAEVEKGADDISDLFAYTFYIVTPALYNYRYKLLSVSYSVYLYPVAINIEDEQIRKVMPSKFSQANSEEEFKEVLKAIFGSKKVLHVISVLLSQLGQSDNQNDT